MTRPRLCHPWHRLILLATLATAAACGGRAEPPARPASTRELESLRRDLWRYEFEGVSRRALERAEAIAASTTGATAADLWSQISTSRIDWALIALLGHRAPLLETLVAHLGLPTECVREGRVRPRCLARLSARIAEGFRRAASYHRQAGDAKETARAERRVALVRLAIVHRELSRGIHLALRAALNDEAFDIRRWAQLLFMDAWIRAGEAKGALGPVTATHAVVRAIPHPCPEVFRLLDRVSPAYLARALRSCNCSPGCRTVLPERAPGPRHPAGRGAPSTASSAKPRCTASSTAFRPLPIELLTLRGGMALQSLRIAVRASGIGGAPQAATGLQSKLRGLVRRFQRSLLSLKVLVPLPPEVAVGSATLRPPALRRPLPATWEFRSHVHLVVRNDLGQLGITPALAASSTDVVLLPVRGDRFPGRVSVQGQSRFTLGQTIRRMRETAVQELGPDRLARGLGLYLHRDTRMEQVARWVARLHAAGVKTVELLFGDGHGVDRALQAVWSATRPPAAPPVYRRGETYGAWLRRTLSRTPTAPGSPPRVTFFP